MDTLLPASPAAPAGFRFWTPAPGATVEVGADRQPMFLPSLPLPVHCLDREPDGNDIGQGIYDYLRQYPDSVHASDYAELLRDAYPHFLSDLAAHIVMLNEKEVDAPFIERKVTGLKILALLDPDNPALLHHLAASCWELGLMFTELAACRRHFLAALGYLQRVLVLEPGHAAALNLMAQIDYWFGDYLLARSRWQQLVAQLPAGETRQALSEKVAAIERQEVPDHPLVDDFEAIGESLMLIGNNDHREARAILERLEEDGIVLAEAPMAEFFQILGLCREHDGDPAGAFAAYEQALSLDATCTAARAGQERIASGGHSCN